MKGEKKTRSKWPRHQETEHRRERGQHKLQHSLARDGRVTGVGVRVEQGLGELGHVDAAVPAVLLRGHGALDDRHLSDGGAGGLVVGRAVPVRFLRQPFVLKVCSVLCVFVYVIMSCVCSCV